MVEECKPHNFKENCPYFEEKKKGVSVEMPIPTTIEEVPSVMPDFPAIPPKQRLL